VAVSLTFAANQRARTKISAAVEFSGGPGYFLVVFHQGVASPDAERIIADTGLVRIERPDLVASQWLVKATEGEVFALAEREEVAYIFPASEELASGVPVQGCAGPLIDGAPIAQYISTIGHGWDGFGQGSAELTYSHSSLATQVPRAVIAGAVQRALAEWSRYAAVRFKPASHGIGERNLDISFLGLEHGDAYPFDGRGRVLAHTFYPAPVNPEPIAGDIHLDIDENWTDGGSPDIYSVVLHEVGHALGLGHSDRPGAVMYPYYRQLGVLQPDDVAAIRRLYAEPAPEPVPPPPATPAGEPPPAPSQQPDTTRPTIAITSPSATSSTSAASVRVSGTARDNVGVAKVTWQRGGETGTAAGTGNWSFELPLLVGTNNIIVRAHDAAGNVAWRTLVVTRR
jgi:hypothetical protein